MAPFENTQALVSACAKEVCAHHLDHGHIGVVASDLAVDEMSVSLDQCLRSEMPKVRFEPSSDLLNSLRIIKSPAEIRSLRASTQLAEAVAEALRKAIKPGESDLQAVLAAERPARSVGARCDVIISTDASRLAYPATNLKFTRKSTVICEITVELNGYWVQICRTFSIGKPSAEQKQVFSVVQRAYRAALAATRSDNTAAGIWKTMHQSIARDGCEKCIPYGLGHGVGLDLPELFIVDQNCEDKLRSGMVLVIHPGVFVPGRGSAFTGGPVVVGDVPAKPLDHPQAEVIEI
jgi:Xaa-Pro aminopeptidase